MLVFEKEGLGEEVREEVIVSAVAVVEAWRRRRKRREEAKNGKNLTEANVFK